jgi:flagellar biosynthesis anti-sigma factor FlgM
MKIDLNGSMAAASVEKSEKQSAASSTTTAVFVKAATADRTTFQSDAKNLQSMVQKALTTPEVRQGKIDAVRSAFNSGTFKFDSGKVADAMIEDSKS